PTNPILLGFYGHSNSGKTTLLEAVIPRLEDEGMKVATIKQTHHDVTADAEGKDTWRHRQAGADPVSLSSDVETALFLGRLGQPAEVGQAIVWLCSPMARHITGQVINVDGGQYI
ncbi:MAG TPA: molybdopterin-guanine dinucleotide biosynthesis protein B, partial [Candidatus Thalassarchaeaceae archaeon]|nr:molybdopterin-guanine dinucleotide biosynthesis protein B [Candidatus Thalassarchaeaceae archaeon]